jgi:uncharacterized protein YecE (DUF72 family)
MKPVHIGISGWRYTPWRGVFYPPELVQHRELEFASHQVPTIEINGTFYSLQDAESFQAWYEQTPPGFIFSVKGSSYITHRRRLKDIEEPLARFFASGVLGLREKLGPFLWQFPPFFPYKPERFESFFRLLPRTTEQAIALVRRFDAAGARRMAAGLDKNHKLRHAVEIRHESFRDAGFAALLRRNKVALVVADTAGKWPYLEEVTADFLYLRLHGDVELYASGYSDQALARWAERIRAWAGGSQPSDAERISRRALAPRKSREVFVYFDNDVKVHAPNDARTLIAKVGELAQQAVAPAPGQFEPKRRARKASPPRAESPRTRSPLSR